MSSDGTTPPLDYKVFCFGGIPKFVQVDSDWFSNHTRNFYDTNRKLQSFCLSKPSGSASDERPVALAQMLDIASKLAAPLPFIRVDMHAMGDQIRVGELTNCPEGGTGRVTPLAAERTLGGLFKGDAGVNICRHKISTGLRNRSHFVIAVFWYAELKCYCCTGFGFDNACYETHFGKEAVD